MPQPAYDTTPASELTAFFSPRAIALFGASRDRNKIGSEILHNLVATGFRGAIYPIHPVATEIQGLRAYASIRSLTGQIELAVVVVPADHVDEVVDECLAKAVPAICIISAGFGECSAEGRQREQGLVTRARAAGCRIVGPNCMGLLNTDPAVRLNATFSPI